MKHGGTCGILTVSEKGSEGEIMKHLKWIVPVLLVLTVVLIGYPGFEKEYVFMQVESAGAELSLAVDEDGNPVSLRPQYGEFDFTKYKTGDILRAVPLQIQEIYPANVIFLTCRKTGHTDEIPMNEGTEAFFAEAGYQIAD